MGSKAANKRRRQARHCEEAQPTKQSRIHGAGSGLLRCARNDASEVSMMIDVIGVRRLGGFKLELEFSDGTVGVRDFESIRQRSGTMIEPLKDPSFFARVFVEDGALTWPNGYDWEPIALHDEMKAAGLLRETRAVG
jgi:hypothetical protein